jgi:hypothetical protein
LAAIPSQSNNELSAVDLQLRGSGPQGSALTYTQVGGNLPQGVSLNRTTGVLTGTISASAVNQTTTYSNIQSATFSASFVASDGTKESAPQTLVWTVRDTYIPMPNYVHLYGCGASCGESAPDLAQLLSPTNRKFLCHIGTAAEDQEWQSSSVYAQQPAPGTSLPWGGDSSDSITYYYPSTTTACP